MSKVKGANSPKVTYEQIDKDWNDLKTGNIFARNDPAIVKSAYESFDELVEAMAKQESLSKKGVLASLPSGKVIEDDISKQRGIAFTDIAKKYSDGLIKNAQSTDTFMVEKYLKNIDIIKTCLEYSKNKPDDFYSALGTSKTDIETANLVVQKKFIGSEISDIDTSRDPYLSVIKIDALMYGKDKEAQKSLFDGTGYTVEQFTGLKQGAAIYGATKSSIGNLDSSSKELYIFIADDHQLSGLPFGKFADKLKEEMQKSPELAGKDKEIDQYFKNLKASYDAFAAEKKPANAPAVIQN